MRERLSVENELAIDKVVEPVELLGEVLGDGQVLRGLEKLKDRITKSKKARASKPVPPTTP